MSAQTLVHYKIRWKPTGYRPGAVRGVATGIGDQLRALVLLRDHPDPRRLDLRSSIRDPFERLWVRDFYLNTSIHVIVLLDASASMGYQGSVNRMEVARAISKNLAMSAYRSSDSFGLFTANQSVLKDSLLPPRLNRSGWKWVHDKLSQLTPSGRHVDGLIQVASTLPKRRSLVFIISDFRWEGRACTALFKRLQHHDVVPIVLQDPSEVSMLPDNGFCSLRDLETGQTRFVWMRERLKHTIEQQREKHLKHLYQRCKLFGFHPFRVLGEFKPEKLTEYFLERQGGV